MVDEGQNPRDEAVVVLEEATDIVSSHTDRVVEAVRARRGDGAVEAESRKLRLEWGAELAEISQGLALAHLIFTTDRSEDARIEKLLREASILLLLCTPYPHIAFVSFSAWSSTALQALALREELHSAGKGDDGPTGDVLNAFGSLRQKQKRYADAEAYYTKSLNIRQARSDRAQVGRPSPLGAWLRAPVNSNSAMLSQGLDSEKLCRQAQAQSLTSLGNLYVAMAEEARPPEILREIECDIA